jgi:tRNA (cmo5U34)-methyltransferase
MTQAIDRTRPADGAKWKFDGQVAAAFDDMLSRSIPDYATMRRLVLDLGSRFVQPHTDIVDLGCSRGTGLAPFVDKFGVKVRRYFGFDESAAMVQAAADHFQGYTNVNLVRIIQHDLRLGLPAGILPSVILSVLTLQFLPVEYRQRLIADAFQSLRPGGVLVLVEKVLGPDADADRLLVRSYYDLKRANGYTQDQIESKRKSLEGVLSPLTAAANVAMLQAEGFRVSQFWQALNFAGWLAVKPENKNG